MKLILWGTGRIFNKYKSYINLSNVEAFVDNNKQKWGTKIENIPIISPNDLFKYNYDYIIIMTVNYSDIRIQIKQMNIDMTKIIDMEHLGVFKNIVLQKKYDVSKICNNKGKIALFSHTLDRTGAPLVLLNLAKVLIDIGYEVDVYSFGDDKIVMDFLQIGIPVTMFFDMNFDENYCQKLVFKYDIVFVNTIALYKLIDLLKNINKPIVWWLHEEEDYIQKVIKEGMKTVPYNNLSIYGVSDRVIETFNKYYPDIKCTLLPYGIQPQNMIKKKENDKIIFAIIGSVCKRKGQDILLDAIIGKSDEWKNIAEFWIIGSITEEKKKEYEKCALVKVIGECNHLEVMQMYEYIDVVVCPSLNDPLPVVVAEGMQQKKVCIVSDMTGMAKFILQYKNGLVCESNNSKDLQKCIQWIIDNTDKIDEIGINGYEIYENKFSMELFKDRLIGIINKLL